MDYITIILMLCTSAKFTDKAACEIRFTACVDELSERPAAKKLALSKEDLATHLLIDAKNQKALCK